MKPSEFKISISVEYYNKKTAKNYRNFNVVEKCIVSKLSKISIPNFNSLKIVSKFRFSIFYTFREISRQRALR